jgi:type VI secretion system protein ImpC
MSGISSDARWDQFRDTEAARHVVLAGPRTLARETYDPINTPVKCVKYTETVQDSSELNWCSASYSLAGSMARSFAETGWCISIMQEGGGGRLFDLPSFSPPSSAYSDASFSLEVPWNDDFCEEVALAGVAPVDDLPNSGAFFRSLPTVKRPARFDATDVGRKKALQEELGTQLPYLMLVGRLAHRLKVIFESRTG